MRDKASDSIFKIRVAVLWTINDFLVRWNVQGYYGCPACNKDMPLLRCRRIVVYYDQRQFWPAKHPMRKYINFKDRNEIKFPLEKFLAIDILEQL